MQKVAFEVSLNQVEGRLRVFFFNLYSVKAGNCIMEKVEKRAHGSS